jgi:TetR/AcrR family transcriptional repressor of nem operon
LGKAGTLKTKAVKHGVVSSGAAKPDTAEKILDLAEGYIQSRGYSAFSYQDIADALDIKRASIHYYFESKTDLGIAVIDRYAEHFSRALDEIAADEKATSLSMLEHYTKAYAAFADTPDRVCLCGALAGEILALPPELRERVSRFFTAHQQWIAKILKRGVASGEFHLADSPAKTARLIFGTLQGALLVKRATGDASQMKDVIQVLKAQLKN